MVGSWLPVALISLVLLVTPSMASPIINKTARLPSGMIGSSNIDTINQSNPLFQTYLNQIQPSQGNGQLRQSLFLGLSPYYRDANTLSGHTEYFLFYFPMTTVHYNSVLNGTVYFIFTDGSTYTYPWKITFNWWSETIGLPLILYMSWSFSWIYKSCKVITCDLNYYEDGQIGRASCRERV